MAFAGIMSYLCRAKGQPSSEKKKSPGASKTASGITSPSSNHEELDFEDLEGALKVAMTSPKSRKRSVAVEEEKAQPMAQEVHDDDGWGDAAWGNDGWDE